MKYFKKLEGKKIYLSPISVEDYELYTKWMNDRSVTDGTHSTSLLVTIEGEKKWIEQMTNSKDYIFDIVLQDKDILIGNCSITKIDYVSGTAELGKIGRAHV